MQKSCYCSDECKPPEPVKQQKEESPANDPNFPEQQLIQQTYYKMLAAKSPLPEDVDALVAQLVKLYPEDDLTLHKISYRLPLDAVFKISAFYGTHLK
ncbi:hypothetical protein BZJ19_11590 [Salinivibrio proteolyticus]|nr:hypothetical protein BZJ19_11590 [Salinivibrio proteolyticus]